MDPRCTSSRHARCRSAAWLALAFQWPLLCCQAGTLSSDPESVALWPGPASGSESRSAEAETVRINQYGERVISNVHVPSIAPFLPRPAGSASAGVIVVPGGGHTELWMDHEGYNVARFLSAHGLAAFVLKYRLARAPGSHYTIEGQSLPDVKRAVRLARSRATDWNLDPNRIGLIGFSAGGELVALASTHYDDGKPGVADPVERCGDRPSFEALLYPAIPAALPISAQTPPAFLLGGANDQPAVSLGLAQLYLEFKRAGAPAELHIYDGVGHGFGMRPGTAGPVANWPQRFLEWLTQQGFTR